MSPNAVEMVQKVQATKSRPEQATYRYVAHSGLIQMCMRQACAESSSPFSNVAGIYIGYDITIDLDGVEATTGDVETRSINGYSAGRVTDVTVAFTTTPTSVSIFHISNWQTRQYVTTGYNPVVTITGVNFITGVLQVSAGLVVAGFVNDAVRQTATSSTTLLLEDTSPKVRSALYCKFKPQRKELFFS